MGALENYGRTGTLTIDGLALNGPAWDIPDLSPLWISGEIRGSDRTIPGAAGVLAYPRRRTVTEVDLDMLITGDVSAVGVAYADAVAGLAANLEVLRTLVVEPVTTGDGTRSASLTVPGETFARTGDVHVFGLDLGPVIARAHERAMVRATLTLSIPAGRLS